MIAIASVVCNAIGRFDRYFSIMAIIVGLHFLPLARLFAVSAYYAVEALLCLIGLVGLGTQPVEATVGAQPLTARAVRRLRLRHRPPWCGELPLGAGG